MAQETPGAASAAIAVPNSTTKDASMQEKETFRFFDLPRELRNLVYQELTASRYRGWKNDKGHEYEDRTYVDLTDFCLPECRLLSRQFKSEYDGEVFRSAKMTLRFGILPRSVAFQQSLLEQWRSNDLFGMHKHVLLSLDLDMWEKEQWDGHLRAAKQMVPGLVAALPSLQTFSIELDLGLATQFDEAVTVHGVHPLDFFAADFFPQQLADKDSGRGIHSDQWLLIDASLFCTNEDLVPDLDAMDAWESGSVTDTHNVITYRATPAAKPQYGWHGLDLSTVSAGTFDVVKAVILQQEAEAESYNTAYG